MKTLSVALLGIASSAIIGISAIGAVSADSNSTGNVGKSGIPRSVFKQDKLEAMSKVLDTTTTNIQTAHKDKTFSKLISGAGLNNKTYRDKVKSQLNSDLEAQGYSQNQVTIAYQHIAIKHLRHHK